MLHVNITKADSFAKRTEPVCRWLLCRYYYRRISNGVIVPRNATFDHFKANEFTFDAFSFLPRDNGLRSECLLLYLVW